MALDAYAAAIEIDEKEPRAFLGRADAYMGRAARKIREAEEEADYASAEEDLTSAEKDIEKAEELIGSDEYAPSEEEMVSGDQIEEYRENIDRIREEEEQKKSTDADLASIVERVLGLPYIGGISYDEYLGEGEPDLYDGAGYISALIKDLDGDDQPEILVVSLEGEDTLGPGKNALYIHVLENDGGIWKEQARQDTDAAAAAVSISGGLLRLDRSVFLRSEEEGLAIYASSWGTADQGADMYAWALRRYLYDGEALRPTPMAGYDPSQTEIIAPYYFFDDPFMWDEPYSGDQREDMESFWRMLHAINDSGIPLLSRDSHLSDVMLDDTCIRVTSFFRELDYEYEGGNYSFRTNVLLTDGVGYPVTDAGDTEAVRSAYMHFLSMYEGDIEPAQMRQAGEYNSGSTELHYFHLDDLDHDGTDELITMEIVNARYEKIRVYRISEDGYVEFMYFEDGRKAIFDNNHQANGSYSLAVCSNGHIHNSYSGGMERSEDVIEAAEGTLIPRLAFREIYSTQTVSCSEYGRPISQADFESLTSGCSLDLFEWIRNTGEDRY